MQQAREQRADQQEVEGIEPDDPEHLVRKERAAARYRHQQNEQHDADAEIHDDQRAGDQRGAEIERSQSTGRNGDTPQRSEQPDREQYRAPVPAGSTASGPNAGTGRAASCPARPESTAERPTRSGTLKISNCRGALKSASMISVRIPSCANSTARLAVT